MYDEEEIKKLDERCVLMNDEIGHVCVRLFKRADHYEVNSIAYMGRQLDEKEACQLTRLWNDVDDFLRKRSPQKEQPEEEE